VSYTEKSDTVFKVLIVVMYACQLLAVGAEPYTWRHIIGYVSIVIPGSLALYIVCHRALGHISDMLKSIRE